MKKSFFISLEPLVLLYLYKVEMKVSISSVHLFIYRRVLSFSFFSKIVDRETSAQRCFLKAGHR